MSRILVYNPVNGHGHLDSWCVITIESLIKKGFDVQVLTPNTSAIKSAIDQNGTIHPDRIEYLQWEFTFLEKLKALVAAVHRKLPNFVTRLTHKTLKIRNSKSLKLNEEMLESDVGSLLPLSFTMHLNAALSKTLSKPDLVLNLYMDVYRTIVSQWKEVENEIGFPVAGFRFVPYQNRREGYLELEKFRGLCLFEPQILRTYQERFQDKCFHYLPDVTTSELPESLLPLVEDVMNRSRSRKIVFLGGSIGGQKNLSTWAKTIELLDSESWFFVLLGEQHRDSFSQEDLSQLAKVEKLENVFIVNKYVEDERLFNQMISICDVVFAVYRNFTGSSNMLIKAAHFSKPIVVSQEHEMGDRVREYGTGFLVSETDPYEIANAIILSQSKPVPEEAFDRYRTKHSVDGFAESLDHFVQNCIGSK